MMSNNFVELKGSVFKKFDKNNLFQLTCSDVRERVHLSVLLFVVVIQTMKEFHWTLDRLYVLMPDCACVLMVELLIDWLKHAFITRFNELPSDVYQEYTISLAYDMTQTRQKHAFSDHSDLVSRRMGFIPYPLSIVLIRALYTCIPFNNGAAIVLVAVAFVTVFSFRVLNTICCLGKACALMQSHQDAKAAQSTPTASGGGILIGNASGRNAAATATTIPGVSTLNATPKMRSSTTTTYQSNTTDMATSPVHPAYFPLQRSHTVEIVLPASANNVGGGCNCVAASNNSVTVQKMDLLSLGATALFSNSDVDLDDICLNEQLLNATASDPFDDDDEHQQQQQQPMAHTRSVPDLQHKVSDCSAGGVVMSSSGDDGGGTGGNGRRTHKRSESEPSIQNVHLVDCGCVGGSDSATAPADRS